MNCSISNTVYFLREYRHRILELVTKVENTCTFPHGQTKKNQITKTLQIKIPIITFMTSQAKNSTAGNLETTGSCKLLRFTFKTQ